MTPKECYKSVCQTRTITRCEIELSAATLMDFVQSPTQSNWIKGTIVEFFKWIHEVNCFFLTFWNYALSCEIYFGRTKWFAREINSALFKIIYLWRRIVGKTLILVARHTPEGARSSPFCTMSPRAVSYPRPPIHLLLLLSHVREPNVVQEYNHICEMRNNLVIKDYS